MLCVVEGQLGKEASLAGMGKEQAGWDKVPTGLDKEHCHQQWVVDREAAAGR